MRKALGLILAVVIFSCVAIIWIQGLFALPPANPWWPYTGSSSVDYGISSQTFVFNQTAINNWQQWIKGYCQELGGKYCKWGYEHDVKTYDAYVRRGQSTFQWATNLPSPYLDTGFGDPKYVTDVTVGSCDASQLQAIAYWDWMTLEPDYGKQVRPGYPPTVQVYAQRTWPKNGTLLCTMGCQWCMFVWESGGNRFLAQHRFPGATNWSAP